MNKIFIVTKGHTFINQNGVADENFKIHKVFKSEEEAIKEAKKLFINNLRAFFSSQKSECDNQHFKDFDEFFNKCCNKTYKNEESNLNNFFIDFIDDYYCYSFENDTNFEKPDFLVRVEFYYVA